MVAKLTNVLSLTRNGLRDWLVQRVSAVILAAYIIFLFAYILCHPGMDFFAWENLFAGQVMKIFSVLFLWSLMLHAWVGMWTVITDYIKPMMLALTAHLVVIISLLVYFIWGIQILWGVSV